MKNSKGSQRDRVIYEFAVLLQPFEALVRVAEPPSAADYRIAIAAVSSGDSAWRKTVAEYTTFAPDISFAREFQNISHVPERLRGAVGGLLDRLRVSDDLADTWQEFKNEVAAARKNLISYVDEVPVSWQPLVFEANTPFTSYLRIKEAIAVVRKRLHYFDRHLKPEFFSLFLAFVDRNVEIRLVTTEGAAKNLLSVSNLARQEFSDYQLIQVPKKDLHDRNLLVDDQLFSLGPGVDRAGMALTNFGPSDSSSEALRQFESLMNNGQVVRHS